MNVSFLRLLFFFKMLPASHLFSPLWSTHDDIKIRSSCRWCPPGLPLHATLYLPSFSLASETQLHLCPHGYWQYILQMISFGIHDQIFSSSLDRFQRACPIHHLCWLCHLVSPGPYDKSLLLPSFRWNRLTNWRRFSHRHLALRFVLVCRRQDLILTFVKALRDL